MHVANVLHILWSISPSQFDNKEKKHLPKTLVSDQAEFNTRPILDFFFYSGDRLATIHRRSRLQVRQPRFRPRTKYPLGEHGYVLPFARCAPRWPSSHSYTFQSAAGAKAAFARGCFRVRGFPIPCGNNWTCGFPSSGPPIFQEVSALVSVSTPWHSQRPNYYNIVPFPSNYSALSPTLPL